MADHEEKSFVLVTGASSGIGAALAKGYAGKGYRVVAFARRLDRLKALSKGNQNIFPFSGDVTDRQSLKGALNLVQSERGTLEVVVANAGYGVRGNFEALTLGDYQRQFDTNVFGVMNTLWESLPQLRKSCGSVGIVGSIDSYLPMPGFSAYSMSKFALRGLAYALSKELEASGVSVTLINPGYVESEFGNVDNHNKRTRRSKPYNILHMDAQTAAEKMMEAIQRREKETIITNHGKLEVFFQRHLPWARERFVTPLLDKLASIASNKTKQ